MPADRVMVSPGIGSGTTPSISLRRTCEVANESMSLSRRTAAMKEIEFGFDLGGGRLESGHAEQCFETRSQQDVASGQHPWIGERARRLRPPLGAQRMAAAGNDRDGVGGERYGLQSRGTVVGQGRHDEIEIAAAQRLHEDAVVAADDVEAEPRVFGGQLGDNSGQRAAEPRRPGPDPELADRSAGELRAPPCVHPAAERRAGRHAGAAPAPCWVRTTPRGSRTKSVQSSEASSRRTALVRPGWVTPSAFAAALKLPWRATALK